MQRAISHQTTFSHTQTQATRVVPAHVTGLENQAVNDDSYQDEGSLLKFLLLVLVNVIGGTILLASMFFLPHVIARILN